MMPRIGAAWPAPGLLGVAITRASAGENEAALAKGST